MGEAMVEGTHEAQAPSRPHQSGRAIGEGVEGGPVGQLDQILGFRV